MTQATAVAAVSHEGCTWKFSEESCREYKAALAAAEAEVSKRFGPRPGFGSPDAVAAWEHEVIKAAHSRLFADANQPTYKGARLPADTTDTWATVEAFRRGKHSPVEADSSCCPHCGRRVEYWPCRWTDCPGNAGVEDTNYL